MKKTKSMRKACEKQKVFERHEKKNERMRKIKKWENKWNNAKKM